MQVLPVIITTRDIAAAIMTRDIVVENIVEADAIVRNRSLQGKMLERRAELTTEEPLMMEHSLILPMTEENR